MVDVEADGPIPGDYSMVCFGAVIVEPRLERSFYGKLRPISDKWIPEALAVSGFSREATLDFDDPKEVMTARLALQRARHRHLQDVQAFAKDARHTHNPVDDAHVATPRRCFT